MAHRNDGLETLLSGAVCLFGSWTLALKGSTLLFGPGLSAVVCLFGSWTLALKGSTLPYGPGRNLAWAFPALDISPILADNHENWIAQKAD